MRRDCECSFAPVIFRQIVPGPNTFCPHCPNSIPDAPARPARPVAGRRPGIPSSLAKRAALPSMPSSPPVGIAGAATGLRPRGQARGVPQLLRHRGGLFARDRRASAPRHRIPLTGRLPTDCPSTAPSDRHRYRHRRDCWNQIAHLQVIGDGLRTIGPGVRNRKPGLRGSGVRHQIMS